MTEVRRLSKVAEVSTEVNRDDKAALCLALATKYETDKFETRVDTFPSEMSKLISEHSDTRWRWDNKQQVFDRVRDLGLRTPDFLAKSGYPGVQNVVIMYEPSPGDFAFGLTPSNDGSKHFIAVMDEAVLRRIASDFHLTYPNARNVTLSGPHDDVVVLDASTLHLDTLPTRELLSGGAVGLIRTSSSTVFQLVLLGLDISSQGSQQPLYSVEETSLSSNETKETR